MTVEQIAATYPGDYWHTRDRLETALTLYTLGYFAEAAGRWLAWRNRTVK